MTMSAKLWFSTWSMAGPSGLGSEADPRPAHAATTARTKSGEDREMAPISTPDESSGQPTVVPYREEFRAAFEQLNRDWIESYFVLEEADREVFRDPVGHILDPGGQIFFVVDGTR